ncbi:hypothetical protein XELAEV_18041998mg [Xenopus laevis]|uniref:Helix-turn-helix domain-containing protein n=1 Tax=Xenopus laevis TaxID=8355 RepID=A0A974C3A6_XENLA|nr:hypothetical protein XELAEV_18041998mg [Xenopus laevis]
MRSNVAPAYANIFMNQFETKFVYANELFKTHCKKWMRYMTCLQIPFLDTNVYKSTKGLLTDLYVKPTDRNLLLHFKSFHPPQLKKALPKSQLSRVKRIVASNEVADKRLVEMCEKFREREYPDHLLQTQMKEIQKQNRAEMLKEKPKGGESKVTFVTQYNTDGARMDGTSGAL